MFTKFIIFTDYLSNGYKVITTLVLIFNIPNILLPSWTTRSIYQGFIKQLGSENLIRPIYFWLTIPSVALPMITFFGMFIFPIIETAPLYLTILSLVGIMFMLIPPIMNLLVIGTPCAYITNRARMIRLCVTVNEHDVSQLVNCYKDFQESASPHLFIVYSFTTVQLILYLYLTLFNICKNLPVSIKIMFYHVLYILLDSFN